MSSSKLLVTTAIAMGILACSKDETKSTEPAASSAPVATLAAPPPSAAPSASAAEAVEPPHDCPASSSGPGSYAKPCEAKGTERMMDVKWTKTNDQGPNFAITNKSEKLVILFGKIAVYFYDKAGKQLELKDELGKAHGYHTCSGQFFGGPMNPKEKAVLTFSCVPPKVVPDGTTSIQAEMQTVGFADASGKKLDFYWRNAELTPDVRPKSK